MKTNYSLTDDAIGVFSFTIALGGHRLGSPRRVVVPMPMRYAIAVTVRIDVARQ
jgi:hypothetical protein